MKRASPAKFGDIRLGIGVITFNRKSHVLRTLEKVVSHTRHDYRLVVADDGSSDGTADALVAQSYSVISGQNMGVCWNKNRALFYLHEIEKCNVILLLEDDAFPTKDGWENSWISAVRRYGHIGLAGSWFKERFTTGAGDEDTPFRSPVLSGQCVGYEMECLTDVGYFDTRFKGYGVGHVEHSMRCVRAGYGGELQSNLDRQTYMFYLINSDLHVTCLDEVRNPDQIARNQEVLRSLEGEPIYRRCWRNDVEERQMQQEIENIRLGETPLASPALLDGSTTRFDEEYYLARYHDVADAVKKGSFRSGFHHYQLYGRHEERVTANVAEIESLKVRCRTGMQGDMRVTIVFSGIARSTALTMPSIRQNVYDCNAGCDFYTIASLNSVDILNNARSREKDIALNPADSFLLKADHYAIVRQDQRRIADLLAAAKKQRNAFDGDWASTANLLHHLASLRRAWDICEKLDHNFFLFLRPDLTYLDQIQLAPYIEAFSGGGNVALPPWHSHRGYNDRFAFADRAGAQRYATRLDFVAEYCELHPLHSETFLAYALRECKVWSLPVRAKRVRATGAILDEDFQLSVTELPIPTKNHQEPMRFPEMRGEPALRRIDANGHLRVSGIDGAEYLPFLRELHRKLCVRRYLEIGTQHGLSLHCATAQALAIDPKFLLNEEEWAKKADIHLFEMTSDVFFAAHDANAVLGGAVDLAFIDGMHLSDYVLRDFVNVERLCRPESVIVLHDAIPQNFEMTERMRSPELRKDTALAPAWTGDVWRVVPLLKRERPDLQIQVLDCQPTGIVLISNLDPWNRSLSARLPELTAKLASSEPPEAEFWSYIESLPVLPAAQYLETIRQTRTVNCMQGRYE